MATIPSGRPARGAKNGFDPWPASWRGWMLLVILSALLVGPLIGPALAGVKAYRGEITLPTYPWWPAVKHPYFQATDSRNIYPYPMLDNLSRQKQSRTYRTVVLENEYLRLVFLPEIGGKVYEVTDKTSGKQMFYVNQVVKPGLIGQCGAWVSGGIEFNTGPAGHTVSAMLPVDVVILPEAPDGSRSVAVGEVERIYRTRWTVVATLRPGRSYIEERVRIYNLTETVRPYYFWNCTAVPNTPGFRFIYPMTLGTDHGGTTFYTWPVSDGKDLSKGTSYQDASSIFAYQCDQDFFGSYDDQADYGVVAHANHHQLPGKKAWTWGHGSYGTMHQMDLTDADGPYNEVQTGPLLTQADVGRLDPSEAVSWLEWWYPIRGMGGFTFANRDVAVNVSNEAGQLRLRAIGTGTWDPVEVRVLKDKHPVANARCGISPVRPVDLRMSLAGASEPLDVELRGPRTMLARFRVPLDLPVRTPPAKATKPQTAFEHVRAGWQDFLFARFGEASSEFKKALELDSKSAGARVGLAFVSLDTDPASAAREARAALESDPDLGMARLALAVAESRVGVESAALDHAWAAALDPQTAVSGRALVAKLLLRRGDWKGVCVALSEPGPWQADPVCRNRHALALIKLEQTKRAVDLAAQNLADDPLDAVARSLLWLAGTEGKAPTLADLARGKAQAVLDLAAEYSGLGQHDVALRIIEQFYIGKQSDEPANPLPCYWAAYLNSRLGRESAAAEMLDKARAIPGDGVFPHRIETVPVLETARKLRPNDGKAALYLGHLLFSLGRHQEGRDAWRQAVQHGGAPGIALRALGMAALHLDANSEEAAALLGQAHSMEPSDAIIARDLARVLFSLADKAGEQGRRDELVAKARDVLKAAFEGGRGRSDFVALLARAYARLGQHAETARLLDTVRITIWEGAREAHDLFEEAHLALGKAHFDAGRAAEALKEFNRALEYPENLATGKLEGVREAHIHYLRGCALAALDRKRDALEAWKKAANEPSSDDTKKEEARKKAAESIEQEEKK